VDEMAATMALDCPYCHDRQRYVVRRFEEDGQHQLMCCPSCGAQFSIIANERTWYEVTTFKFESYHSRRIALMDEDVKPW